MELSKLKMGQLEIYKTQIVTFIRDVRSNGPGVGWAIIKNKGTHKLCTFFLISAILLKFRRRELQTEVDEGHWGRIPFNLFWSIGFPTLWSDQYCSVQKEGNILVKALQRLFEVIWRSLGGHWDRWTYFWSKNEAHWFLKLARPTRKLSVWDVDLTLSHTISNLR